MKKKPGRKSDVTFAKDDKLSIRSQITVSIRMWWVKIVHIQTGECYLFDPLFLVRADTAQEAIVKVEKKFDREQWPKETYKLDPQIVEFGEMGEDVAYL